MKKDKIELPANHRQQLRESFLELDGVDFSDEKLLDLLLSYTATRGDTEQTAQKLLREFCSFREVLDASPQQLKDTAGLSDNAITLLQLVPELYKRTQTQPQKTEHITTLEGIGDYFAPYFANIRQEKVYLLSCDEDGRPLACDCLSEGGDAPAVLSPQELLSIAQHHHAVWVALAHNHPSGLAIPSGADVATTRRCLVLLAQRGIELRDHLIFADDDYTSMRQSNLL